MRRGKLLIYSTVHLAPADLNLLEAEEWPPVNASWMARVEEVGHLLWVGDEGLGLADRVEFEDAGFTPALAALLDHAHKEAGGDTYILLDCDADPTEGLVTHDYDD